MSKNTSVKIKRALLSVSDKSGITELAKSLENGGVEIVSTGGTLKHLADEGIKVKEVSDFTGSPEMMEGRVKTLEGKRLGDVEMVAKENRRYIREVIQPSYNISDAWANPHFDAWLKQGGWADAPVCPFAK